MYILFVKVNPVMMLPTDVRYRDLPGASYVIVCLPANESQNYLEIKITNQLPKNLFEANIMITCFHL